MEYCWRADNENSSPQYTLTTAGPLPAGALLPERFPAGSAWINYLRLRCPEVLRGPWHIKTLVALWAMPTSWQALPHR